MLLEIEIKVFEGKTKEGKKFNYYKAVQENGRLIDVRFRKDVNQLPKQDSILIIKANNINKDNNRIYPCLWVKEVEEIKPLQKENKVDEEVTKMFKVVGSGQVVGENSIDKDKLPF